MMYMREHKNYLNKKDINASLLRFFINVILIIKYFQRNDLNKDIPLLKSKVK